MYADHLSWLLRTGLTPSDSINTAVDGEHLRRVRMLARLLSGCRAVCSKNLTAPCQTVRDAIRTNTPSIGAVLE